MSAKISLSLLSLFPCLPVSAKIGETKDLLATRYGPAIEENGDLLTFSKSGILVKADLKDGKCARIRFAKDVASGIEGSLSQNQISALFAANQDGLQWTRAADGTLRSSDGQRQAVAADGSLVIQTAAFTNGEKAGEGAPSANPGEAPVRVTGPAPTRVGIMAKTASAGSGRDKKWTTWWGSYDKDIFRDRVVGVSLRASTPGQAIVETHWIGEEIEKKSGNKVVEVSREAVLIPGQGQVTVEMGCLFVENDTKYAALGVRERKGIRYAGWVVRVLDGGGNVLAVQGSRPPLIALVR
ncbi:MAG: hypothetical protein EOP87_07930 [Verrucomicrobiaceae bacterium]|nr:MAG: hypothetical protein EOP87_07930 [Verrucomicrobiaceae bacterium]